MCQSAGTSNPRMSPAFDDSALAAARGRHVQRQQRRHSYRELFPITASKANALITNDFNHGSPPVVRNPQSMANADNDARAPSIAAAAAARDPVRSQLGGDTNGSILSAVSGRPLIKASVDLASVRPITRSVHGARGRAGLATGSESYLASHASYVSVAVTR
jgi:hypothetical protein